MTDHIRITTSPGEVLLEEFLKPMDISINKLARDLDVPPSRISAIVNNKRELTADTALRLAAYFKTTPHFWLNLQQDHSLSCYQAAHGAEIEKAVRPLAA